MMGFWVRMGWVVIYNVYMHLHRDAFWLAGSASFCSLHSCPHRVVCSVHLRCRESAVKTQTELRADAVPRTFGISAVFVLFLVGNCKIIVPL